MFKIAYDAGHGKNTAGKRLPKELDANQTREWVLNDRIARYFAKAAEQYENVELLRVDDPTGKTDVSRSSRCKKANNWGADMYLSIHHNAGIKLGTGGGIVAFSYREGTKGAEYRDSIYVECIAAGGLKGNRSDPTQAYAWDVLRNTKAPAVLMEYGFMDSSTDAPVILTDSYAKKMAYATMEGIAKAAGLRKKKTYDVFIAVEIPVLKKGAKGDAVKAMQILLIGHGYELEYGGKTYNPDSSFGNATDKALRAYQEAHGLAQDGSCGPKTWSKLLGVD